MTATPYHPARGNDPSSISRALESGYGLLRQGRFEDALHLSLELAAENADHPHVLVLAAEASLAHGNPKDALAWIDKAISASHDDPFLKLKKARLLGQMRRRGEVPKLAAEISTVADGNGKLLWQLGALYYRNNLQSEAIAHFEKARALVGDQPGLLYDLAMARFFSGDFEQAERDLERMLIVSPQAGPALYLRSTLRRQMPDRNHVMDLERRIKVGFRKADDEAAAQYALAKELEDLGEHERSFAALSAGAAKRRSTLQYDVSAECESLEAIRLAYTEEAMSAPIQGHDEEGAIFIVGMPRTGTTLAERMLVQSGMVRGAGELLDFGNLLAAATQAALNAGGQTKSPAEASLAIDFRTLGREYMRGARDITGDSPMFIDKMPINFLYCGMIRKALPKAKIIHLVRDPLDCCYAVFKTLFFNSYSFSYDLGELADYYIAYHNMMRHWHRVMPNDILDVKYEDLVTDTESQTRRIYDWCCLPWSPDVIEAAPDNTVFATASAAQVREPVHNRSVGNSRKHHQGLAVLIAKLSEAGIIDKA